ncbi:MAG: hypothetical protein DRG82_12705 [Deltaproteobacteria bacterium]|nr:MAG: hypothetical protein DRG82_12705 [Deltaproteobacteria bacterium]
MFEVKGITINIRKIFACYPFACNILYSVIIKNSGPRIAPHAFPLPHPMTNCKCDAKKRTSCPSLAH